MRASTLTSRPAELFNAQITFGGFEDRFAFRVLEELPAPIPDFNHADGVIGTVSGTDAAPDTSGGIDRHLASESLTMDRAGGTADHANGIDAMHAGVGHHKLSGGRPMPQEAWIIIMRRRAG